MAFVTSSAVKGGVISFGGIFLISSRSSSLKVFSKCFAMSSACSWGSAVSPSVPWMSSGFLFSLFAIIFTALNIL